VKSLTGCFIGAVPPFGSMFNMKTYYDISLEEATKETDIMYFHCGLITGSISMKFSDFKKIENAIIIDCTKVRGTKSTIV